MDRGRPGSVESRPGPAVLQKVRERDPQALSELFEACFDRVYGLAHRLLGERSAAEDAAQEVFLKVHRAAHRIDPSRDPGPWLTTITYNVCRDHWRSRWRRLSRRARSLDDDPGLADSLADPGEDQEAAWIRSKRERLLFDALMQLPEPQRAVVILHDYEGLDHETIAGVVGSSHAAVRKRHSRALATLREKLDGLWS